MAGIRTTDKYIGDLPANAEVITPSDAIVFDGAVCITCFDGTLVRIMTEGGQILNHFVIPGVPIGVKVKRVYATTTNATKIVATW